MSGGCKIPRKAAQSLQKEVGQNIKDKNWAKIFRDVDPSWEGIGKEEKSAQSRKLSHRRVCGEFWNLIGQNNQEGGKITQNVCLTTTASGEVAHLIASATSEWGLGREMCSASSVLRVRTGPECPEDSPRELMRHSNPNHRTSRERTTKKNMNSMKRGKDGTLKDEFPRSGGAQYSSGDQLRNKSKRIKDGAKVTITPSYGYDLW